MRWFTKWRLRFQSLFDRSRVEDDLEDELRDYIDREIEREVGGGATPEEARRRALSSLGGTERLKEECRDARGIRWLEDTLSDVRFAVRTLRKAHNIYSDRYFRFGFLHWRQHGHLFCGGHRALSAAAFPQSGSPGRGH